MATLVYVTTAPAKLMTTACSLDLIPENRHSVHDVDDTCIDPPCKVREGLYIGSLEAEKCLKALRTAKITHILQVGGELRPSHPEAFTYKRLVVGDDEKEDLIGCFSQAFEFIEMALKSGRKERREGAEVLLYLTSWSSSLLVIAHHV